MRRVAAVMAVLGLLVACGSSSKNKSSGTTGTTVATTAAAAPTQDSSLKSVAAIQTKLKTKGITCAGTPTKPKAFYGIQGKESVSCRVDGTPVQITVYASSGDLGRIAVLAKTVGCVTAKGKHTTYIAAGTWLMGATFSAKNSVAVNQKLADAVGAKPTPVTC